MDPNIRIGDAERDEAARRLGEHHAAGRISITEFDDRMVRVFDARTAGELEAVFRDLPGTAFGESTTAAALVHSPVPAFAAPPQTAVVETKIDKPFFRSSGFFWLVFFVALVTGFRIWPVLVGVMIWSWVIVPMLERREIAATMHTYPVGDQRAELRALLRANRKVEAVKRYREMHGVGLLEAKQAIDAIEREERGLGR